MFEGFAKCSARAALLLWAMAPVVLQAQELPSKPEPVAPPQQNATMLRSSTRLVLVSVTVQNKKGEPVTGLTKDDFAILDGGKAQSISVFTSDAPTLTTKAPALPPNYFTNRYDLKGEVPGTVTVVLFDALNTSSQDQSYVRKQILKFLQTLKPQDHVAIYGLTSRLVILQDFTRDSAKLVGAVEHFQPKDTAAYDASHQAPVNMVDMSGDPDLLAFQYALQNAEGMISDQNTINRVGTTAGAMEAIADHIAEIPGRKNLVWVSGGFPLQIGLDRLSLDRSNLGIEPAGGDRPSKQPGGLSGRGTQPVGGSDDRNKLARPDRDTGSLDSIVERAIKALNRANVAIYPVDTHGVEITAGVDPAARGNSSSLQNSDFYKRQESRDSSRLLADRTGGEAFYGNNDIGDIMKRAFDDGRYAYTIGFYPDHGKWDGKFREIKVQVKTEGTRLRYRKGYFASENESKAGVDVSAELQEAAVSPLEATVMGIMVSGKAMPPVSDRKLELHIAFDPKQCLLQEENGKQKGAVDLFVVQRGIDGNVINMEKQHLDLNFEQKQYEYLSKAGVVLAKHVTVDPKSAEVRVVLRDAGSGSLGTVTVPMKMFFGEPAATAAGK